MFCHCFTLSSWRTQPSNVHVPTVGHEVRKWNEDEKVHTHIFFRLTVPNVFDFSIRIRDRIMQERWEVPWLWRNSQYLATSPNIDRRTSSLYQRSPNRKRRSVFFGLLFKLKYLRKSLTAGNFRVWILWCDVYERVHVNGSEWKYWWWMSCVLCYKWVCQVWHDMIENVKGQEVWGWFCTFAPNFGVQCKFISLHKIVRHSIFLMRDKWTHVKVNVTMMMCHDMMENMKAKDMRLILHRCT